MNIESLKNIDGVIWISDNPVKPEYDGFEMIPERDVNKDNPEEETEFWRCTPEEAEVWVIFGYVLGEPGDIVADCKNEATAVDICSVLALNLSLSISL